MFKHNPIHILVLNEYQNKKFLDLITSKNIS